MPGLLETCESQYGSEDLYTVLGLKKDASSADLKRAYYKVSMKVHPDRVPSEEKEEATAKFQTLGKVYTILSDKEKRAVYDETGEVDEENDIPMDRDWYDYWRLLFAKISMKDIDEFEVKYKGSDEEKNDLAAAYIEHEGDMDLIIEHVMCATVDDEERYREILNELIKKKEVPKFKTFSAEKSSKKKERKRRAAAEAAEAEEMKQEMGLGDGDEALRQMIMQKQGARANQADNFFAQLEAKYANQGKKKKGKK